MEDTLIYSNVATELIEIFNYLDKNTYDKIPQKVIENLKEKRNKEYTFTIDKTKTLDEQNLLTETKQILSILFLKYCCTKEEVDEILEINKNRMISEEEEKYNKYNPNNIFKNRSEDLTEPQETQLMVIEEEKTFSKIINKIINFFGKIFRKKEF